MTQATVEQFAVLVQPDRLLDALPEDGDTVTVEYLPRKGGQIVTMLMIGGEAVYGFDEDRSTGARFSAILPREALIKGAREVCADGGAVVFASDGHALVLHGSGTRVQIGAVPVAGNTPDMPRAKQKPASGAPPAHAPDNARDAAPVIRALVARSRQYYGLPQLYAEPEAAVNLWIDPRTSVLVTVTDTETRLTAYRYDTDPLKAREVIAHSTYAPLSGAQVMALLIGGLYV